MNLPRTLAVASIAIGTVASSACGGVQSALHPAGNEADIVARLSWTMFISAALVLVLVTALTLYAIYRDPERRIRINGGALIFVGGVLLPTVSLTALLAYSLVATRDLRAAEDEPSIEVQIIGHQWWWEVRYLDRQTDRRFTTSNELHLPLDERTHILLSTVDVIHSFWAPPLAGKIDLIPGKQTQLVLHPTQLGVYRAQCAEFCGAQHARMALDIVVHDSAGFEQWRERQHAPAMQPTDALARRGEQIFMSASCAWCHTVRGTRAQGLVGPDLTHVGSRSTIASGTYPATTGYIAGWIADAQHMKPGSLMPSFRHFSGEELRALTAYVESLE